MTDRNINLHQDINPLDLSSNVNIYSSKINSTLKTGFENIDPDSINYRQRKARKIDDLKKVKVKIRKVNPDKNNTTTKNKKYTYRCKICGKLFSSNKINYYRVKGHNLSKLCNHCKNDLYSSFVAHLYFNGYLGLYYNSILRSKVYKISLEKYLDSALKSCKAEYNELIESKEIILSELLNLNKDILNKNNNVSLEDTDKIVKLKNRLNFINESLILEEDNIINTIQDKIKSYYKDYIIPTYLKYRYDKFNTKLYNTLRYITGRMSTETVYNFKDYLFLDLDLDQELIISDNFNINYAAKYKTYNYNYPKICFERFKYANRYNYISELIYYCLGTHSDFLGLNHRERYRQYKFMLIDKFYYERLYKNLSRNPESCFSKIKDKTISNKNFKLMLYQNNRAKLKLKELYKAFLKISYTDVRDYKQLIHNLNHKYNFRSKYRRLNFLTKKDVEDIHNFRLVFKQDIDNYINLLSYNLAVLIYYVHFNLNDYKLIDSNYIEAMKYRFIKAMVKKNKKRYIEENNNKK